MMTASDPRGVVVEHLTRPSTRPTRPLALQTDESTRPVAIGSSGNPFTAQEATIRFIKERAGPNRWLYAVTFEDQDARPWFWLIAAERDQAGRWAPRDVAGGSGASPQRAQPWLNFCGSWGQGRLYAGGEILSAGASVAEVRLTLADGTQLTDDALADVALFLSDQTEAKPAIVDIHDADGQLLATHGVF